MLSIKDPSILHAPKMRFYREYLERYNLHDIDAPWFYSVDTSVLVPQFHLIQLLNLPINHRRSNQMLSRTFTRSKWRMSLKYHCQNSIRLVSFLRIPRKRLFRWVIPPKWWVDRWIPHLGNNIFQVTDEDIEKASEYRDTANTAFSESML